MERAIRSDETEVRTGENSTMIDLAKFCAAADSSRDSFKQPLSKGDWTYACDGNIAVRVPRREDVPEREIKEDLEKLFNRADSRTGYQWVDVPSVAVETFDCVYCDGKGKINKSRTQTSICEWCAGTGRDDARRTQRSIFTIDGVVIGLSDHYLELINKELPSPQIGLIKEAAGPGKDFPVKIRFDGGEGLLMAMRT